jgi:hypothetical protein
MSGRLLSLVVVVAALTGYHVAQRSMPAAVRPAPLFAFVYGAAALVMIAAVTFDRVDGVSAITGAASHWAPWMLVLSVAGIELGVYAMYRTGWSISTASVSTQAIAAALLLMVGLWRFGEHLTPTRLVGLTMCVLGAGLVAR